MDRKKEEDIGLFVSSHTRKPRTSSSRKPRSESSHTIPTLLDIGAIGKESSVPPSDDTLPLLVKGEGGDGLLKPLMESQNNPYFGIRPHSDGSSIGSSPQKGPLLEHPSRNRIQTEHHHRISDNSTCRADAVAPSSLNKSENYSSSKEKCEPRNYSNYRENAKLKRDPSENEWGRMKVDRQGKRDSLEGRSQVVNEKKNSGSILDVKLEKASNESLPTKLKLKVCGVTHTINSQLGTVGRPEGKHFPAKKPSSNQSLGSNRRRQRLILQDNSDDEDNSPFTRAECQTMEPDFLSARKDLIIDDYNMPNEANVGVLEKKNTAKDNVYQLSQASRKSSRVPKKRVLDGEEEEMLIKFHRQKRSQEFERNQYQAIKEDDDVDMESTEEGLSSGKQKQKRKPEDDFSDVGEVRKEAPLTARQRSLQSSKEGRDVDVVANPIEFFQGLSHSVSRKKKDPLTEAERQVKKEEAAQRRRQQMEKAAKEIQAVAIQKVLSQDSSRKKREDKLQKQRDEIEQEKRAAAMIPPTNSIRWVLGPSGKVVSFSQDLNLPEIFSGPCSYPKEREKCAGPSCTNTYKYRDSKSKLPLCSLHCYKAVQNLPGITNAC